MMQPAVNIYSALLALGAAAIWGITPGLTKMLVQRASVAQVMAVSATAFALCAWAFVACAGRFGLPAITPWPTSDVLAQAAAVGVAGYFVGNMLYMAALREGAPHVVVALTQTSVVFAAIAGVLLFGEHVTGRQVVGMALCAAAVLTLTL